MGYARQLCIIRSPKGALSALGGKIPENRLDRAGAGGYDRMVSVNLVFHGGRAMVCFRRWACGAALVLAGVCAPAARADTEREQELLLQQERQKQIQAETDHA